MNTEPTNITEALAQQLAGWVQELQLSEGDKADFTIAKPHKIDPEKGILQQAFIVTISRQMERVNEPAEQPQPLPPIPPVKPS